MFINKIRPNVAYFVSFLPNCIYQAKTPDLDKGQKMKITGQMNQSIDRFFTAYPEEISQWMKNTNRIPQKHLFMMRMEGLGVALNIKEFTLWNDGYLHIEGNLVLPKSWVNKTELIGFYFDNDGNGIWALLSRILDEALDYAKVGA
jgi:hypothetical protein